MNDSHSIKSRSVEQACALVRNARRVVAFTGAGISAESGVPTFRNNGGYWKEYRVADLATVDALERDPHTVWEFYDSRRALLPTIEPNPGHRALARFFLRRGHAGIITQNVDGLHTRAALEEGEGKGADPGAAMPIELHGNISRDRCQRCGASFAGKPLDYEDGPEPGSRRPRLPRCDRCGGLRRPDVVLFGEMLNGESVRRAEELAAQADLCLVIGTGAEVYPAAGIPRITLHGGGQVIEVNPKPTALSPVAAVAVRAPSGEVLGEILETGDA